MSVDKKVTKEIMETLADGRDGFLKGAEKLTETDAPELAQSFRQYGAQRAAFYDELEKMAASYGDDIEETGSVAAAAHRGWMAIKDALAGSSPSGVLEAAVGGEHHAVNVYEEALKEDLSPALRDVLARQHREVLAAQTQVEVLAEGLRNA